MLRAHASEMPRAGRYGVGGSHVLEYGRGLSFTKSIDSV